MTSPLLADCLDILVRLAAEAVPSDRKLLSSCKRCRNQLLYLLDPPSDPATFEHYLRARLRAQASNHEQHAGVVVHCDDQTPRIA